MLELMCRLNDIYAYHICLVPQKKEQKEDIGEWRISLLKNIAYWLN